MKTVPSCISLFLSVCVLCHCSSSCLHFFGRAFFKSRSHLFLSFTKLRRRADHVAFQLTPLRRSRNAPSFTAIKRVTFSAQLLPTAHLFLSEIKIGLLTCFSCPLGIDSGSFRRVYVEASPCMGFFEMQAL